MFSPTLIFCTTTRKTTIPTPKEMRWQKCRTLTWVKHCQSRSVFLWFSDLDWYLRGSDGAVWLKMRPARPTKTHMSHIYSLHYAMHLLNHDRFEDSEKWAKLPKSWLWSASKEPSSTLRTQCVCICIYLYYIYYISFTYSNIKIMYRNMYLDQTFKTLPQTHVLSLRYSRILYIKLLPAVAL